MRKLLCLLLFVLVTPCWATSYFISPSGSDSNNGLSSGAPWLSPNHALNCGDTISAASGTYSRANFVSGKWGTVTCPSSNNVAWLICATFDACKISTTNQDAMWVDQNYWGVVGWETTVTSGTNGACFRATPSGTYILHHVIFADDIANGCEGGGFVSYNTGSTEGTDYLVEIGDIAYNAAQGSANCFSGFSNYQPLNFDTNTGTHLFLAGNFSYANLNPNPCAGSTPTDGEGFIMDTFDHSQGGFGNPYTGQTYLVNNTSFFNGGRGLEIVNNTSGSSHANVYFEYNTSFGNSTDPNQTGGCFDRGELYQQAAQNITWQFDLAQTRTGTSCSSEPLYGFIALSTATGSLISNSWWSGTGGHNTDPNTPGGVLGTGNTIGTNPSFSNPVNPGAPSCGSSPSTAACMATVISDYTPTAGGSTAYGRQAVSNTSVANALFPQWLCTGTATLNPNIPANLVTPGCGVVSAAAAPTFSPVAGTYAGTQTVTLSTISVGAIICYNTTGAPATNGTTGCATGSLYSSPVSVSSSETLHAVAGGTGFTDSSIASAAYVITTGAATPTFSPVAGIYVGTQTVTASTSTSGCASFIYFDTNPTPVTNQTTLSVTSSETVYAYVHGCPGHSDSSVGSAAYTISAGVGTKIAGQLVMKGGTIK